MGKPLNFMLGAVLSALPAFAVQDVARAIERTGEKD